MQSEQTRQWRRERKRFKREEKQQSLQSSLPVEAIAVPRAKMSDVLVEFVRPLLGALPDGDRPEPLKKLLQLAAIIWNAVVEEVNVVQPVEPYLTNSVRG